MTWFVSHGQRGIGQRPKRRLKPTNEETMPQHAMAHHGDETVEGLDKSVSEK